jgi:hypothetical protein
MPSAGGGEIWFGDGFSYTGGALLNPGNMDIFSRAEGVGVGGLGGEVTIFVRWGRFFALRGLKGWNLCKIKCEEFNLGLEGGVLGK